MQTEFSLKYLVKWFHKKINNLCLIVGMGSVRSIGGKEFQRRGSLQKFMGNIGGASVMYHFR